MCAYTLCNFFRLAFSVLGLIAMGLFTYALFEMVRILMTARRVAQRIDMVLDIRKWIELFKYLPFFKRK